jgi:phosphoribosylpyrophosphate synthetase
VNNRVCGIDIGVNGALSIVSHNNKILSLIDMPNFKDREGLYEIGEFVKGEIVYIERPFSPNGNNNVNTNIYYGMVLATCKMFAKEVYEIMPNIWTAHYGLTSNKQEHVKTAKNFFKSEYVTRHDKADSLLIAKYGNYIEKIKSRRR